jgi:hypothetical protein
MSTLTRPMLPLYSDEYATHVLDASPEWQILRAAAMLRAAGRCEYCDFQGRGLTTAHLTYQNLGHEDLNDLVVLCGEDHRLLDHGPARVRMILRMMTNKWRPPAAEELEWALAVAA